eukprot:6671301-Prymnesium_polylepis.1
MYTNASYHRLPLGKPPSHFRLAMRPPQQIAVRQLFASAFGSNETSRLSAGTNHDAIGNRAAAPAQS